MHHYTHHISLFVKYLTLFYKENGLFSVKFKEIMRFQKLLQMMIKISAYMKIENALNNVEVTCLKSDILFMEAKDIIKGLF